MYTLQVESPGWWAWLAVATTTTFRVLHPYGNVTVRRERIREHLYWYAYRKRHGRLAKAYLGKTSDLTLARLHAVARTLTEVPASAELPPPANVVAAQAPAVDLQALPDQIGPHVPHPSQDLLLHPPWLTTKVHLPALRSALVERPRLLQRLQAGLNGKLTLLTAPAGAGKTTLLLAWAAQLARPVAWVSLDAADNDLVRFLTYLIAALHQIQPDLAADAVALLHSPQPPPLEPVLTLILNALMAHPLPIVLMFDDYQLITATPIHQALAMLLTHLPPSVHLVIASRAAPPLPLARLRAARQLTELRAPDLVFTDAELTSFLTIVMRLQLPPEQIAALTTYTEGWVAGVQLAALALQDSEAALDRLAPLQGDHRFIRDYVVEEVVQQQPPAVQTFIQQTIFLEQLHAPLCAALLSDGRAPGSTIAEAQGMLETLERANLFLMPLDAGRRVYRYHHLFADALRSWIQETDPDWVAEFHCRAMVWYSQQGLLQEALSHAFAAGAMGQAAQLIEQLAQPLLLQGQVLTIQEWLARLPPLVVRARPRLCLILAWHAILRYDLAAAHAAIQDFEQAIEFGAAGVPAGRGSHGAPSVDAKISRFVLPEPATRGSTAELWGHYAALRAALARYQKNAAECIAQSQVALAALLPEHLLEHSILQHNLGFAYDQLGDIGAARQAFAAAGRLGQQANNSGTTVLALSQEARLQVLDGQLAQAAATYQQALALATTRGWQQLPVISYLSVGLGELCYEWNDLSAAQSHFADGLARGQQGGLPDTICSASAGLAFVYQAQGHADQARACLDAVAHWSVTDPWVAAAYAQLALLQDDLPAASRWAAACRDHVDDASPAFQLLGFPYLTLARITIAQGLPALIWGLLGRLRAAATMAGQTGALVHVLALQALACQGQGATTEALTYLGEAVQLAASAGYVRTFVDAGSTMALLLRELRRQYTHLHAGTGAVRAYLKQLCAACTAVAPAAGILGGRQQLAEPLSERELAVLRLLARGLSNQAIADALVVGVNTIRTHLQHIYRKLDVRTRTEAIARAQQLQLLNSAGEASL
ncbi:MAG: LuxR C-terminal-related transcriptional regulator [Roseiflexaceae bacterium]